MMIIKIDVAIDRGLAGDDLQETIELEMEDEATAAEIEAACAEAARDAFFNVCNYGWSITRSEDAAHD